MGPMEEMCNRINRAREMGDIVHRELTHEHDMLSVVLGSTPMIMDLESTKHLMYELCSLLTDINDTYTRLLRAQIKHDEAMMGTIITTALRMTVPMGKDGENEPGHYPL